MNNLFRKEAVENYSSERELTLAVKTIPVRWLFYVIITLICAVAFAVWLFYGTVYETVSIKGVAWSDKNSSNTYAEASGVVTKTTVSDGDKVEAGDILAVVPDNDMLSGKTDGESLDLTAYDRRSVIRAKESGIVTYIINKNSYVNKGDKIASVVGYDENGNNDIITAFIPDGQSDLVDIGMEAQIMPDYTPREQYGYIVGYVSGISEYPMTGEQIYNMNGQLYMSEMDTKESYIEVEITMMRAAGDKNHLKWSKESGESKTVNPGTRCDVDIILNKYRPYRWLLRWEQ